jgi:hypothetical protein
MLEDQLKENDMKLLTITLQYKQMNVHDDSRPSLKPHQKVSVESECVRLPQVFDFRMLHELIYLRATEIEL